MYDATIKLAACQPDQAAWFYAVHTCCMLHTSLHFSGSMGSCSLLFNESFKIFLFEVAQFGRMLEGKQERRRQVSVCWRQNPFSLFFWGGEEEVTPNYKFKYQMMNTLLPRQAHSPGSSIRDDDSFCFDKEAWPVKRLQRKTVRQAFRWVPPQKNEYLSMPEMNWFNKFGEEKEKKGP